MYIIVLSQIMTIDMMCLHKISKYWNKNYVHTSFIWKAYKISAYLYFSNVGGHLSYDSIKLRRCALDGKLALFSIFSVGLITVDLGADSFQSKSYIEEGNKKWGYTTISLMFVPLLSVCVYVILNRRVELWQNKKGVWWDCLKKILRHFPFVQPFVHYQYLKKLMDARAKIKRSLNYYQSFRYG